MVGLNRCSLGANRFVFCPMAMRQEALQVLTPEVKARLVRDFQPAPGTVDAGAPGWGHRGTPGDTGGHRGRGFVFLFGAAKNDTPKAVPSVFKTSHPTSVCVCVVWLDMCID